MISVLLFPDSIISYITSTIALATPADTGIILRRNILPPAARARWSPSRTPRVPEHRRNVIHEVSLSQLSRDLGQ